MLFMSVRSSEIKKILKRQFLIICASSLTGIFVNNYAGATILNNSYKEVIDHVWQIVYRDFLDSNGQFEKSEWIDLRK